MCAYLVSDFESDVWTRRYETKQRQSRAIIAIENTFPAAFSRPPFSIAVIHARTVASALYVVAIRRGQTVTPLSPIRVDVACLSWSELGVVATLSASVYVSFIVSVVGSTSV